MKPSQTLTKYNRKLEELKELSKVIDAALHKKLGEGYYLVNNGSEGAVILFGKVGDNTPITPKDLDWLLSDKVSVAEAIKFLNENSI